MPLKDKLIIAFTGLLLIAGPYLTYKAVEVEMREDARLAQTTADSSAAPRNREAAEIKRRYLPPIVIGQVGLFALAQIGLVVLSALIIREHKRRRAR